LRAEHRGATTVRSYTESVRRLVEYRGRADALDASTDDLRRFVAHLLTHRSPATVAVRYRSLQRFYGWAVRDGLIDTNPMTTMRRQPRPRAPDLLGPLHAPG
jgi:site-specific recombinase XerD